MAPLFTNGSRGVTLRGESSRLIEQSQRSSDLRRVGLGTGASAGLTACGHLASTVASHVWIDQWMADWGARNKVDVSVDHILGAQVLEKIAAEVATGAGHEIIRMTRHSDANLYSKSLVDVTDLAKQLGQQNGGWVTPLAERLGAVDGVWKAPGVHYRAIQPLPQGPVRRQRTQAGRYLERSAQGRNDP